MKRVILDLCGGTGGWSRPYAEDGNYDVYVIDPQAWDEDGGDSVANRLNTTCIFNDVRELHYDHLIQPVHGILCAPPCTVFANAGARWPRTTEAMQEGISIMDACLRIVNICKPEFWALENPVGKMKRYLGPPVMYFNPCDYGDPYTKKTCLWGEFTKPKMSPVPATEGSKMHLNYGGRSARTKRARSATPQGFANAFFKANR